MTAVSSISRIEALPSQSVSKTASFLAMPSFSKDPIWAVAEKYLKHNFESFYKREPPPLFPEGHCRRHSEELFLLLCMHYQGHFDASNSAHLIVDGKEALLFLRHPLDFHYYLELWMGDEVWLIDPTWKQFAGTRETNNRSYFQNSPYNLRVQREFPDILIAKYDAFSALIESLREEAQDNRDIDISSYQIPPKHWREYYPPCKYHNDFVSFLKKVIPRRNLSWLEEKKVAEWEKKWTEYGELPFLKISDLSKLLMK